MVRIAHASIDENGKIKGGKAGDQTKKEVCIRNWYNKPWDTLIRFNDQKMAKKFAEAMTAAANNDHIGYNQNRRNTLLMNARLYNYDISRIKRDCECDCSSLVAVACMYAGIKEQFLTYMANCATTRTLEAMLKKTGEVTIIKDPKILQSKDSLMVGDILLSTGHHVVGVVEV